MDPAPNLDGMHSDIGLLPPEILSHIFAIACSIEIHGINIHKTQRMVIPTTPTRLSQVCARWHNVAYSTPCLWSSLFLNVTMSGADLGVKILGLFIHLSGDLKFRLEIDASMGYSHSPPRVVDLASLNSVLFEKDFCRRVEYFRIRAPPYLLYELPESWYEWMNEGSLTVLEEMQIGHRYLHPPAVGVVDGPERLNQRRVSFASLPKLRCLLLDNFPYRCTAPSLTTLRLYGVAIETCVDLLFECPGIIDFECRRPNVSDNGIDYPLQATKTVVKKHLRLFEWDFDFANAEWYNDFYTCIRMPRLQRMRLTNSDADPSPFPPSLLTFLESVSSTLKRLTLVTFRVTDSQDVNDIFACVPRIEHLVVEERGNATYSCYREILQALEPSPTLSEASSPPSGTKREYLPSLRTLTLKHTVRDKWGILENLQYNLVDMMEARTSAGDCSKLCITLNGFASDFEWSEYHGRKFEELETKNLLELCVNPGSERRR